jgi:hypothetical protein
VVVEDLVFVYFSVGSEGFGNSSFVVSNLRSIQGREKKKRKEKGVDLTRLGTEGVCPLATTGPIEGSRPAHLATRAWSRS